MTRILLTGVSGVSGVGKSTVVAELASRGHRAVDLDEPGWSETVPAPDGELTGIGGGEDWVWREDRVRALLERDDAGPLVVAGCSANQGALYPLLDAVVLLTAPPEVIVGRLRTRTTNPFGKRPDEVERVLELQRTVEPLLRRRATHVVDTSAPLDRVVAEILRIAAEPAPT